MAAQWERWLRYARAKLDDSVRRGHEELDRREADLEARRADRTWLDSDSDAPSFDEARARIEARARRAGVEPPPVPDASGRGPTDAGPPPDGAAAIDLAAQERAAEERLAAIRDELGLGAEPED